MSSRDAICCAASHMASTRRRTSSGMISMPSRPISAAAHSSDSLWTAHASGRLPHVLRKNSSRDCFKQVVMMQAAGTRASNDAMRQPTEQ